MSDLPQCLCPWPPFSGPSSWLVTYAPLPSLGLWNYPSTRGGFEKKNCPFTGFFTVKSAIVNSNNVHVCIFRFSTYNMNSTVLYYTKNILTVSTYFCSLEIQPHLDALAV